MKAGDQDPKIPFIETAGKLKLPPAQIGATALKIGVTEGLTVIVIVALLAHCPEDGVKVYVVVEVLFKAGDQVPVIPFEEVVGKGLNVAPAHIGATAVKVGVTKVLTLTNIVVFELH